MKIVITNNSLMYNRGSEAVIRGAVYVCRFWHPESEIVVVSGCEGEVLKEINEADRIVPKFNAENEIPYLLKEASDADVVLVTGADNYDYGTDNLHMINVNDKLFNNTKARMILYDCSLSAEHLSDVEIKDINRFTILTAREKRTTNLFETIFGQQKVCYYPDPAFVIPAEKCNLPYGFEKNNTIGLNISNLIMGKRVGMDEEIVLSNYRHVIDYLIHETTYKILIIQHVINNGYDLDAARKLYRGYENEPRVSIMETELLNAMQVKYVISKLRMLITARTHASIAAYSMNVPTLVVGYSVKSIGIAEDLFGECEKYVTPVRSLKHSDDLLNKFKFILENESEIRNKLVRVMPEYKLRALKFGEILSDN